MMVGPIFGASYIVRRETAGVGPPGVVQTVTGPSPNAGTAGTGRDGGAASPLRIRQYQTAACAGPSISSKLPCVASLKAVIKAWALRGSTSIRSAVETKSSLSFEWNSGQALHARGFGTTERFW